jgi:hypothetical protein
VGRLTLQAAWLYQHAIDKSHGTGATLGPGRQGTLSSRACVLTSLLEKRPEFRTPKHTTRASSSGTAGYFLLWVIRSYFEVGK